MRVRAGRRTGTPVGWFDSPRTQEVHETPSPDGQGMCMCATWWSAKAYVHDLREMSARARPVAKGVRWQRMCERGQKARNVRRALARWR